MSGPDKAFTTLQARAALLGLECERSDVHDVLVIYRRRLLSSPDGRTLGWISRGSDHWYFSTVEKAEAWLNRLDQPGTQVQAIPTQEGAV